MPYFDAQETANLLQQYERSHPNQRRSYAQAEAFITRLEDAVTQAECVKLCAKGSIELRVDEEEMRLRFVTRDSEGHDIRIEGLALERALPRQWVRVHASGVSLLVAAYGTGIITGLLCAALLSG